jgi:YHS domain-containing protein
MMKLLVQLGLLLFVLFLLRRFIAAFVKSPNRAQKDGSSQDAGNRMVKDPVCGMYMDQRLAVKLEKRSEVVHFCSEECKNKYINKSSGGGVGTAAAG